MYNSEDVAKHQDEKTGIWISYKNGVYDITSFVKRHPGNPFINQEKSNMSIISYCIFHRG